MPVTIKPSDHGSSSLSSHVFRQVSSPESLLQYTITDDSGGGRERPKKIVQSSFKDLKLNDSVFAAKNGFVHACMEAYNAHHRLVIRPEDVWFAILTQLSIYVNTNSEELRGSFVSHSGQRSLHIEVEGTVPVEQLDQGLLAYQMTKLMEASIQDPSLREWILPAFTTTNKVDQAVASVIFMGTLQKYFTYSWGTRCGLPTVTLLGEASDWAEIRRRCMTRLPTLGKQCERWLRLLQPVLDGLVMSFQDPQSKGTTRFWQGICNEHLPNGSGTTTYSGWITAFCYWDESGKCLHESKSLTGKTKLRRGDMPVGFTKVPVTLVEDSVETPTEMIAGSFAIRATRSKERTKADDDRERSENSAGRLLGIDTVQPEVGWFMYKT